MKKAATFGIALITALISLIAMGIFDFVFDLIYSLLAKVPFLTDILEGIGEILDIGLTALLAIFIAIYIWKFGFRVMNMIISYESFDKCPLYHVNNCFFLLFLGAYAFLGYHFFSHIGNAVSEYTADFTGFGKALMLWEAIKDVYTYVCNQYYIYYLIGSGSFVLAIINLFLANSLIEKRSNK